MNKKFFTLILGMGILLNLLSSQNATAQQDTLRVVYYNLLKFPGSTANRADSLKVILDYLKPDILCVEELLNSTGSDLVLNSALNHSGNTNYSRTTYIDGFDTETQVFFNTNKVGLVRFDTVSTAGSTAVGESRYIGYTRLYFKDPNLPTHRDTQYIDIFGMHLTASSNSDDSISRHVQTRMLKNWLAARPHIQFILAGGDLNLYTDQEVAYQTLLDSGTQKLKDPINRPGSWNNNAAFADVHTQSTRVRAFNGGATGGLDDRFDFILTSDSILQSNRLRYITNSYKAIGNTGLLFNDSLTHPPVTTQLPWSVLSAMYNMSDHLPVYMELLATHKQVVTVSESLQGLNISISPNPTRGIVYLKDFRETAAPLSLSLFDLNGRELSVSYDSHAKILDLSGMNPGVYLLRVSDGQAQTVQRIILK